MADKHTQYVKISSSDGKNTVESIINDLKKKASKGHVDFGVDITVERVTVDQIKDSEDFE